VRPNPIRGKTQFYHNSWCDSNKNRVREQFARYKSNLEAKTSISMICIVGEKDHIVYHTILTTMVIID